MGEKSIELKKMMEVANVVEYLEALVESLKGGKVVIEKGDKFVSLDPPSIVEVEIEARQKKDKAKFCLELSWKSGSLDDISESLKISSKEPPVKIEENAADVKEED